jgi:hypothetical protein
VSRVEPSRQQPYDPNDPRFVATHEAGHAVSAIVLGFGLKSVDIKRRRVPGIPGGLSMGFTDSGRVDVEDVAGKGEEAALPHIIQSMTGNMAEARVNHRLAECNGHEADMRDASRVAVVAICEATERGDGRLEITPEEIERNAVRLQALWERATSAAARLIDAHWPAIERVAALLLQRESLAGDEVAAIVDEGR